MNGHRICIICLPRSGSQLCEILSGEKHSSLQLGEYFENWNRGEYVTDNDNNLILKNKAIYELSKLEITEATALEIVRTALNIKEGKYNYSKYFQKQTEKKRNKLLF